MSWQEVSSPRRSDDRHRYFNIDLHVSVIADIREGLDPSRERLTTWSLSGANHLNRRLFTAPDPVRIVNARTWRQLNDDMIREFASRYRSFLDSFSGFISCYPPAFAQLFDAFERPQLVMAATRYQEPYSSNPEAWEVFNEFLRRGVTEGRILLFANNLADRDYITSHTGLVPPVVPSVCDYTQVQWEPREAQGVMFARSAEIKRRLSHLSSGAWQDVRVAFPHGYSWEALSRVNEVLVIPYNVSTMTLFELATAGIPVSVPSREMLTTWARRGEPGVLSELTFSQVHETAPAGHTAVDDPNHPDFFDWWLDRADFYDSALMPNVRVIQSLEQLIDEPHPYHRISAPQRASVLRARNERLRARRDGMLAEFRRATD